MEFVELVRKISPKLKGIAYRLRRGGALFSEEDLYQEALLHLWNDFSAGRLGDKTDSYILQGCYFHLRNYIRVARDKFASCSLEGRSGEDDGREAEPWELEDERSGDYFERLNREMIAEVIRNNGLTGREKELLPLFAEGLTVREIGARIGVSHVMVLKMKKEIRKKCLKHLDKI